MIKFPASASSHNTVVAVGKLLSTVVATTHGQVKDTEAVFGTNIHHAILSIVFFSTIQLSKVVTVKDKVLNGIAKKIKKVPCRQTPSQCSSFLRSFGPSASCKVLSDELTQLQCSA